MRTEYGQREWPGVSEGFSRKPFRITLRQIQPPPFSDVLWAFGLSVGAIVIGIALAVGTLEVLIRLSHN